MHYVQVCSPLRECRLAGDGRPGRGVMRPASVGRTQCCSGLAAAHRLLAHVPMTARRLHCPHTPQLRSAAMSSRGKSRHHEAIHAVGRICMGVICRYDFTNSSARLDPGDPSTGTKSVSIWPGIRKADQRSSASRLTTHAGSRSKPKSKLVRPECRTTLWCAGTCGDSRARSWAQCLKRKGPASRQALEIVVAGAGFEPATFGL